ncbi:MAG: SufD family Fe-S cluster assembly protein [Paludibacteraceae bacterium]|nr:SufD family Fe-S cluster assembly protein [Paludibacteraceae bacterium]
MTQSSIQHITLSAGEKRDLIFINEPNMNWHIVQEANSSLRIHVIYLSENETNVQWRSTLSVEQNAPSCRTEIYAMGLLHESQQAHLLTRVHHNIGGGYSSQVLKFVLDDQAKGSFRGELKIQPNAQQTEAYQTNRNILLSRQAEMITEPQLEIYADDVKASHGATTGQLDESALFYMQQRCIDRDAAAKLLLCAFFDEVITTLSDTQLQEELVEKINRIL